MKVLAINTVGAACEAAVLGPAANHSVTEEMARGHDSRIAPVVEQVMREASITWPELDRIAVVTGPGSFTGIRVGVAFARGLGLALKRPVAGLTALEALGAAGGGRILAILPAQRRPPERTWWAQILEEGRGVSDPEEIDEFRVRELAQSVVGVAGLSPPDALAAPCEALVPSASAAARVCLRIDMATAPARPVYVRAPDAAPMRPLIKDLPG